MEHPEENVSLSSAKAKDECEDLPGKFETHVIRDLLISKTLVDASARKNVKLETENERPTSNTITVIAENGKVVSVGSNSCYDDSKESLRYRKPLMNISQNERSITKDFGEIMLAAKENKTIAKDQDDKRSPAKENRSIVKYTQVIRSVAKNTEEKGSIATDTREKKKACAVKDTNENRTLLVTDYSDDGFIANIWGDNESSAKVSQNGKFIAKDCGGNKSVAIGSLKGATAAKDSPENRSNAKSYQEKQAFPTDFQENSLISRNLQNNRSIALNPWSVPFTSVGRGSYSTSGSVTDTSGLSFSSGSPPSISPSLEGYFLPNDYNFSDIFYSEEEYRQQIRNIQQIWVNNEIRCGTDIFQGERPSPHFWHNILLLSNSNAYSPDLKVENVQPIYNANGQNNSCGSNSETMRVSGRPFSSNDASNSLILANGPNTSSLISYGSNNLCGPNCSTTSVVGPPFYAHVPNNSTIFTNVPNKSSMLAKMFENKPNNSSMLAKMLGNEPNNSPIFTNGPNTSSLLAKMFSNEPNISLIYANGPNDSSIFGKMFANEPNSSLRFANGSNNLPMLENGPNNSSMLAKIFANEQNNSSLRSNEPTYSSMLAKMSANGVNSTFANTYKLFPNTNQLQGNPFNSMDFLSRPPPNIVSSIGAVGAVTNNATLVGPGVPPGVNGSMGLVGLVRDNGPMGMDISMGMKVSMGVNYGSMGMMNCSVGVNSLMGPNCSTAPSGMRSGSMSFNNGGVINAPHGINHYYAANAGASDATLNSNGSNQNDTSNVDGASFSAGAKQIPSIFDLFANQNASANGFSNPLMRPDNNNNGGNLQSTNSDNSWPRIVLKEHIMFGEFGNNPSQFHNPSHLCVTQDGCIVVADTSNHRIQVFGRYGKYMFDFGSSGKSDGELWYPRRVALLRDGNLLVCDSASKRVRLQVFTIHGEYVKKIVLKKSRVDGQLDRQFPASAYRFARTVAGLTITESGHIVLVDAKVANEPNGNPSLYRIDESGKLLNWFDISKHIAEPSNVATKNGAYYICDFKNHCVGVFSESGDFLTTFGRPNLTDYPNGIDLLPHGYLIVADTNGNRFHACVFTLNGKMVCEYDFPYVKLSKCGGLAVSNGHFVTISNKMNYGLILKVPPNSF